MFSSTIKRSVATLGVVAGLLAAAGPASAGAAAFIPEVGDEVLAVKAPRPNSSPQDLEFRVEMGGLPCARAVDGGNDTLSAQGTQVGSEGVKAPTRADDQVKVSGYTYNPKEIGID